MGKSRLSSKNRIKVDWPKCDRVHVFKLSGMREASELFFKTFTYLPRWRNRMAAEPDKFRSMMVRAVNGDSSRLTSILDHADRLIDEALLIDHRLTRRHGWVRAEDGIDACPALVASGDDRPCLDWRRIKLADQATVEPVRVVISTDTNQISSEHAAAFIAATKLAQQFRPLEVWWQSAWLNPEGHGPVFLVPLISGDMDFSRIQFALSDEKRDTAAYYVMMGNAWPNKVMWDKRVGKCSYLENTFLFVPETGISAYPRRIASLAAHMAGFEPLYREDVYGNEAEQRWSPPKQYKPLPWTSEDEERWRRDQRAREEEEERKAQERTTTIEA